jgi:hypothetical protein
MSGKGRDESLRDLGDRRRLASVDRDRPARRVVRRNASGIATAPRLGVVARKLLDLPPIVRHACARLYARRRVTAMPRVDIATFNS